MMNDLALEPTSLEAQRMTYVVSGHPRSGTSMMMKALMTGGLEGFYRERDREGREPREYDANPGGFFELGQGAGRLPWFPRGCEGGLIKVIFRGLPALAPGNYKVVYMLRDADEIAQSMVRMRDSGGPPFRPRRQGWSTPEKYKELMRHYITVASQRADMEILQVWYGDVMENPLTVFERIRDFGIPIDPTKSVEVVDRNLYRNRGE